MSLYNEERRCTRLSAAFRVGLCEESPNVLVVSVSVEHRYYMLSNASGVLIHTADWTGCQTHGQRDKDSIALKSLQCFFHSKETRVLVFSANLYYD